MTENVVVCTNASLLVQRQKEMKKNTQNGVVRNLGYAALLHAAK